MGIKIEKILNSDLDKINNKNYNIFLGISLGNKYFTKENIKEYILWALKNTKEKVAVLVVDKIHAVNLEVRSNYSRQRALSVALRRGEEEFNMIKKIINSLPKQEQEKIFLIRWQDIEKNSSYKTAEKVIRNAFFNDANFYKAILEIVKNNVNPDVVSVNEQDYEKLADYVIKELPVLIQGFEFKGFLFNLIPYPGIGRVDNLVVKIQEGKKFPNISKELDIQNRNIIVEAYVENVYRSTIE